MAELVYLDTTLWNLLCDQAVDPQEARDSLADIGCEVVLGLNAYRELLGTFYGTRLNSNERAKRLFACLDGFLQAGIRIVDTWENWLIQETEVSLGRRKAISRFLDSTMHRALATWPKGLSTHKPPAALQTRLRNRNVQTETLRTSAKSALAAQPEMLSELRSVPISELESFLRRESAGERGQQLLSGYLPKVFAMAERGLPEAPAFVAATLLANESNMAAHAVVRNDIYCAWRAANSAEVRFSKSIPEDSYHVANACYCGAFVTADCDGQADAARHAVPGVRVLTYQDRHRQVPVTSWLVKSLRRAPNWIGAGEDERVGKTGGAFLRP
jgi:hypothetical protein